MFIGNIRLSQFSGKTYQFDPLQKMKIHNLRLHTTSLNWLKRNHQIIFNNEFDFIFQDI